MPGGQGYETRQKSGVKRGTSLKREEVLPHSSAVTQELFCLFILFVCLLGGLQFVFILVIYSLPA